MNKCRDCKYFIQTLTGKRGGDYGYCDLRDEKFKANRNTYGYWRVGNMPECRKFKTKD